MKRLLSVVFCLFLSSLAFGLIAPEFDSVSIEPGKAIGVKVFLENDSGKEIFAGLRAKSGSPFIYAELLPERVSLNPFERTSVFLQIEAEPDAPNREFEVEAIMEYNGIQETAIVLAEVSNGFQSKGIEIESFEKTLCRGEKGVLRARVTNNSSFPEKARLFVESELFLPLIEPDFLELEAGESAFVEVLISSLATDLTGDFSINLTAQFNHSMATKELNFSVEECPEEVEELFEVIAPSSCKEMEKGEEREFRFFVENLSDEEQPIRLVLESGLETGLEKKRATLEPKEKRAFYFTARPKEADEFGEHTVRIHAFNESFHSLDTMCIELERFHKSLLSVKENNLTIERNSSGVFELVLENTGDFDETYHLELEENLEGVELSLSSKELFLESGETKSFFVNVFVSTGAGLGKKEFFVKAFNGRALEKELGFIVAEEPPTAKDTELRIKSYPKTLSLGPNETVLLELVLENLSEKEAREIEVTLNGLPEGIIFSRMKIDSIQPEETKRVSSRVSLIGNVKPANYTVEIMAQGKGLALTKPFELKVLAEKETESLKGQKESRALVGLTGLIGPIEGLYLKIGLIAIAIVLIFIVSRHQSRSA